MEEVEVTTERKITALTDADLVAMQLAALAEIEDPNERIDAIAKIRGGESIALQREQVEIMRAQHSVTTNAISDAQARAKQADVNRDALAASRCTYTAIVDVPRTLSNVKGEPVVNVRVAVDGHRYGEGERDEDGAPRTGHFVTGVRLEEWSEAEETIKRDVLAPALDQIAHHERAADKAGLDLLMKNLLGKSRADGLAHRFYTEVRLPILRLLAGKTLEFLQERGACKIVGEIVYGGAPRGDFPR